MQRLDGWIIWGHGLQYIRPIMSMLRDSNFLDILYVKKIPVKIDESFIKAIYKEDTYPWPHLVAKTKYLLSGIQEISFILTRNNNVNEIWTGQGEFRSIECSNIKSLKNEIRNRFNPRLSNGKRSENHIIHGTDREIQTTHLMKLFSLPDKNFFERTEMKEPRGDVSTKLLYGNVIGRGIMPLDLTPHYAYVIGNKEPYIDYVNKNWGVGLTQDHFPEAFDKLISSMKNDKNLEVFIKTYKYCDKILIEDGLHRACVLKSLGLNVMQIL